MGESSSDWHTSSLSVVKQMMIVKSLMIKRREITSSDWHTNTLSVVRTTPAEHDCMILADKGHKMASYFLLNFLQLLKTPWNIWYSSL